MSYTHLTSKIIYGRSYNECNHPDCDQLIITDDDMTKKVVNHGEMAHIKAQSAGGERWDPDLPAAERNSADNLILLCSNHHKVIDQLGAGEHYTVELLQKWKADHYLAKELAEDREWVYGASSISFFIEDKQHVLEFWRDKNGDVRFFTPDQSEQAKAALDLSVLFRQLQSIMSRLDQADVTPLNPSQQGMNDANMQVLKKEAESLRKSLFSLNKATHQNMATRLYMNLQACPDITLAELGLVGSTEKPMSTSIIVGSELTPERSLDAMKLQDKRKQE